MNRRRIAATVLLAAFAVGCASSTRVPVPDHRELKGKTYDLYEVTTRDGYKHAVHHVEIRDSTLVLSDPLDTRHDTTEYPYALPLAGIVSIEGVDTDEGDIILVVVGVAAALAALILSLWWIVGLGST